MSIDGYKLSARAAAAMAGNAVAQNAVEAIPITGGEGTAFDWYGGGQQAAGIMVTPETARGTVRTARCFRVKRSAKAARPIGGRSRLPLRVCAA